MITEREIIVKSSFGHSIKNYLLENEPGSDSLLVLFPGGAGICEMPLLHYAREVALQLSCDVLNIEYGYVRTEQKMSLDELFENIVDETIKALNECKLTEYRQLLFLSKSFGTRIAAEIYNQLCYLPIRNLFLTPLEDIIPTISKSNCTVIIGDKDENFPDITKISKMPNVDLHMFNNTAHSLEVKNDYKKSLEILGDICVIYEDFIGHCTLSSKK